MGAYCSTCHKNKSLEQDSLLKTNLLNKILARGRVADHCAAKIFRWQNNMFQNEKTHLFVFEWRD